MIVCLSDCKVGLECLEWLFTLLKGGWVKKKKKKNPITKKNELLNWVNLIKNWNCGNIVVTEMVLMQILQRGWDVVFRELDVLSAVEADVGLAIGTRMLYICFNIDRIIDSLIRRLHYKYLLSTVSWYHVRVLSSNDEPDGLSWILGLWSSQSELVFS